MTKPLIGIVAKPSLDHDLWHYLDIVDELRYVLLESGGLPIGILPPDRTLELRQSDGSSDRSLSVFELQDLQAVLKGCDGIVLQGGLMSASYEVMIAKYCIKNDIPLLGICDGFNNIIKAMGGTSHHDETLFHRGYGQPYTHKIKIRKNSLLHRILKQEEVAVNSTHAEVSFKEDIKGLDISAVCPNDSSVEVVELKDKKFVLGVHFHPELMKEEMSQIFKEFVETAQGKKF